MPGFLIGNKESFNLENRIYISTCLVGAVAGILALIWDTKPGFSIIPNVAVVIGVVTYGVLYYLSRFKKIFNSFIFFFTTLGFLSVLWVLNEGLTGSIPALYIVFTSIFIGISKTKYQLLLLTVTIANFALLIILENQYYDELIIPYPNVEAKESGLLFGYVAAIIAVFLMTSFLKNTYEKEKKKMINENFELQRQNSSKDLFFNIMAHDLRIPFNGILGATELMCNKSSNLTLEEMREFAGLINKSSVNAFELLESLLEWGKIQQGKMNLNPQTINLKDMTIKSVNFFKEECSNKDIKISTLVPGDIDIFADIHIFQTIQRNLINNAIKFTPQGGEICISTEDSNNGKVAVVIHDSGIGMNKEMVKNLFNMGINTNRCGTNGESSTGLGLMICKKLAEKLGGELKVESALNKGSKFTFNVQKNKTPLNISNLRTSEVRH
ncbi:sensor histidine kinase [Saccharicrinis sp. 156]|uniref:sensor histidine kinase n=1 Tax=Saccharicrinis sp. 156 TaxID=3417574 RepID=UPI003D338902